LTWSIDRWVACASRRSTDHRRWLLALTPDAGSVESWNHATMIGMGRRFNTLGQPIGDPVDDWTPRRFPDAVTMVGRRCRVEPLSARHAAALFEALHRDATGAQWTYLAFGPFPTVAEFASFLEHIAADRSLLPFAVTDSHGRVQGMASYDRIQPAVGSIEVGGIMWSPSMRRTAAATEAMYLMAGYVFDALGYRRYEWKCDVLNTASRAAAERLGFRFEGIFRKVSIYKGRNRDTSWYAMTDSESEG
jgi:RimJ/RimL family protein N-acetyltransferase